MYYRPNVERVVELYLQYRSYNSDYRHVSLSGFGVINRAHTPSWLSFSYMLHWAGMSVCITAYIVPVIRITPMLK